MVSYIDSFSRAKEVHDFIISKDIKEIGLDSEFDGVDFDNGDNCVLRSVLDVWSIALFDGGLHPRGYSTSKGVVLSRSVLPVFADILGDVNVKKYAHNSSVDVHTFNNDGVDVLGVVDTLQLARFTFPERFKYGLDDLGKEFLDIGKFISFKELCTEPVIEERIVEVKTCSCGIEGCRKRKGHTKTVEEILEPYETKKRVRIDIGTIKPGDYRWNTKLEYAAQDAVIALCLGDYCNRKLKKITYDNPFRVGKQI